MNAPAELARVFPSIKDRREVFGHHIARIKRLLESPNTPERQSMMATLENMTIKKADGLAKLFRKIRESALDYGTRDKLREICASTNHFYALLQYDLAGNTYSSYADGDKRTSYINRYINQFADADDSDECMEIINEDFFMCNDCQSWETSQAGRLPWGNDYDSICRTCIDNNYTYSSYYDQYVYSDSSREALDQHGNTVTVHEDDDNFSWDDDADCYIHDNYNPAGRLLGSYHSHKNQFHPIVSDWTKLHNRYFGVELEVEVAKGDRIDSVTEVNAVANLDENGKFCWFETDGSLSNGYEIITQPMGLDQHEKFWEWLKTDLTKPLLSHKTTTCGLHIHVSRKGLSKLQLSKMISFVNHPDNEEFITALARRYAQNYARIGQKKISTAWKSQQSRYDAINMEPRQTVEFRLFRGTLKYEAVMASIQFVNALVAYCHDQSGYGFDLSTSSFLKFLDKKEIQKDTKYLRQYIDSRLDSR
jgi:hypothetical protein